MNQERTVCRAFDPDFLVPGKGLEPPQCYHRMDLNHVRLPIPPPGQARRANLIIKGTFVNENEKIPLARA